MADVLKSRNMKTMRNHIFIKVNRVALFVLLWGLCLIQPMDIHAENDGEAAFDVEAGVASLLSVDGEVDAKWSSIQITPEEATYGANIEVLSEEGRVWREIEEQVGSIAMAVASNYVYVREDADIESEAIGKAYGNTIVIIVGEEEREDEIWYQIESGEIKGYIRSDLLVTGEELALLVLNGKVDRAYLESPEDWIGVLSKEEEERLLAEQQAQREAELARLEEQRIAALENSGATQEAKDAAAGGDTSLLRQQIVDYAMQFLGNRYISGGTSLEGGTDCSGFTCFIYKDFGYSIDRTPAGQYNSAGRTISYSEIQPGDIICYGNGTCTHVAIYIGNGQIIHSANSRKGVVIYEADYDTIMAVKSILD